MSPVRSEPRCTPPMPPVANTEMPAAAAMATDADTVEAPNSQRWAIATGMSRSAILRAGPRMRPASSSSSPTRTTPSSTAVTAGIAPPSRIAAVQRSSASRLAGDGRPRLEKIVDSSATTGTASASAVGHLVGTDRRDHARSLPSPRMSARTDPGGHSQVGVSVNRVTVSTCGVFGNRSSTSTDSARSRRCAIKRHVTGERHRVAADQHETPAPPRR